MAVNDDAVALKGGKGPWADSDPANGANERIIIEDCEYGFCHGCVTFGSESVHDRNIIIRNITVDTGYNLLWMKFRPDTPQCYEYVLMENIRGRAAHFLNINPWRQFYDNGGRTDIPVSKARHITLRNCEFDSDVFFNVKADEEQYHLSDFTLENITVRAADISFYTETIENLKQNEVVLIQKEERSYTDAVTTL
jgi:polygalacturonase